MSDGQRADIWKSTALILAGIVVSLVACIWNQTKDQVTKQDLVPIAVSVETTKQQVSDLRSDLSALKGELQGEKELRQLPASR